MKDKYTCSSIWFKEKIRNPYQVVAAAFDYREIHGYRMVIESFLVAAWDIRRAFEGSCSDLLYDLRMLESLINAAWCLHKLKRPRTATGRPFVYLQRDEDDENKLWQQLPKSLSWDEFKDPHRAIRRFFQFQGLEKWKETLLELLDWALSKNYEPPGLNFLSVYFQLTKLTEAMYWLHLRRVADGC